MKNFHIEILVPPIDFVHFLFHSNHPLCGYYHFIFFPVEDSCIEKVRIWYHFAEGESLIFSFGIQMTYS